MWGFFFTHPLRCGSNTPWDVAPSATIIKGGEHMAKAKKPAFGGYSINFKGCSDTLESVMGSAPIGPPEMTKRIWGYVKRKKLGGKKK